jgi:hypothetical protein
MKDEINLEVIGGPPDRSDAGSRADSTAPISPG